MPRTRLAWHLFAGWCSLAAALLVCCSWLASLELARLADEALRQRLLAVAAAVPADAESAALAALARAHGEPPAIAIDLLAADGGSIASSSDPTVAPAAESAGDRKTLVADARAGRTVAASRLDSATGRRFLTVAVPRGPTGALTAIVRVTAETSESDRALARAQRRLLAGSLVGGLVAAAAGYLLARRAVRPVRELSRAAARLAAGDFDTPLPPADPAELAELAAALAGLRTQLVERGLVIGRQGTQQEAVLGSMIEGVLAIDARQRVVGINRAAADLLDVDPGNVIGLPLQAVVRNPDLRRFALTAIDCRAPVQDDIVLRGPRDRTIRLRGTALRDVSGDGGAVIVLDDVTDVQRLEAVRRDFVANVSHELKTPIASIKGFVETLLDGAADDPADNKRFLGIVARQADRLAAIIEDLLALSRIEQSEGAGNLPLERASLADVLAAAVADCGPRGTERSVHLETDCDPDLTADVNAPLLEQAIINLVDNAIKYSEPGHTVWITAAREGDGADGLVIRVRDEGCGIEAEHLPRLFERFYRVDKARSRKLGGTGLGLAIVKHIVQAHGGTVGVESLPGQGTTFTLRLPLTRD
jgi:two-component system phosphate regulon sensor histidine kinase PhoR